jgi:hypothetical protein
MRNSRLREAAMIELTLEELKERLKRVDELTLLELLDISSEDLVELLEYEIEKNFDKLKQEVEYDDE